MIAISLTFIGAQLLLASQVGSLGCERVASSNHDSSARAAASPARPARGAERLKSDADRARYKELVALIHRNLHRGAHFTMAVTPGTIKEVRKNVSERDISILIAMLSDSDPVSSGAAQDLIVTFGMKAVGTLLAIRRSDYYTAPGAALALNRIRNCYSIEQWDRWNPDLCPADRAAHRGEDIPVELPP